MDPLGRTAQLTAADRARESSRADRLFSDPLAELLAGEDGFRLLKSMPQEGASSRVMAIRTHLFDEWLGEVTRGGLRQIVLLGAGMDTRAFRLAWPNGVQLWELDRPELLTVKRQLLEEAGTQPVCERHEEAGTQPVCERHEVGVDLQRDDWPNLLRRAGFQPEKPSAWLTEGLLVYLDGLDVGRLLSQMAACAATDSCLGADFISESFLHSGWMQSYLRWLAEQGAPWLFGTDRPEDVLAASGWRVLAVRQPGEEGVGAGLLPWPVLPRDVPGIPRSFLVTAVR